MDVVLVTARGTGAEPHWSRAAGEGVARAFTATGSAVRWLCAAHRDEPAPSADGLAGLAGIEVVAVPGAVRPFRKVQARIEDPPLDRALVKLLRARPADAVVHLGCGAPGSTNVLWIADRMGARCFAVVRAREALCHRGSLVDERGRDCRAWADADRCRACCTTRSAGEPSRGAVALARLLRPLGSLSPMPTNVGFRNRLDVVVGSLQLAARVFVSSEAEGDWLAQAGLDRRNVSAASATTFASELVDAARASLLIPPPAFRT